MEELRSLKGKTLVCHCGPDELCHADVIADLYEETVGKDGVTFNHDV